ncbi:hypothetical protein [Kordiimonas pumila]|uniref:Phage shock protein B n=1 Tax=Kordiimonas pumila TaxID=2161677 RepID=A0ABV7D4H3_9PROT|nr:hypothetical protein [Kordiimonas pumila]
MDVFTMVVVVVAIGSLLIVIQHWLKLKEKALDASKQEDGVLAGRVDVLEKRIRVLERIATDKSSHLQEEIDAL